jgi:hypothetical protein
MAGAHASGRRQEGGRSGQNAGSVGNSGSVSVVAAAIAAAVIVLIVLVIGGYSLHWRWTGLSGSVTLWDWLQVLALPVALGVAPILMRHRRRLHHRHRRALVAGALGFLALAAAGYVVPMPWTGFTGNTLWDWLELLLLPTVVATASLWASTWPPARMHLAVVAVAAGVLGVIAVLGYTIPWHWTGFSGNTAWDWIKLLLVPIIVPVALLPPVTRYLTERLAPPQPAARTDVVDERDYAPASH